MSQNLLRKLILLALLIGFVIFFSISSPYFLTVNNIFTLFQEASIMGLVAIGFTFVMIAGGLDLSMGAVMAVTGMICINFLHYTTIPVPVFIVIAVLSGGVIGVFNGQIINKLRLPDFIVTLSMKGILSGLALVIAVKEGGFVSNVFIENEAYLWFSGSIGPLYYVIIVFAIVAVMAHILLRWTKFGVCVYASGANKKSAALSGIDIQKVKTWTYIIAGLTASLAAIFQSSRMMTAMPEMGLGSELDIVAAVIIGGTAFRGGSGDISGTILGVLFLSILKNGIFKLHMSTSFQPIIIGGIIMVAVIFDEWYRTYMSRRAQKKIA